MQAIFPLPITALMLLVGICLPYWIEVPSMPAVYWLLGCTVLIIVAPGTKYTKILGVVLFGFTLMCWQINLQLSKKLPIELENIPLQVQGTIVSMVTEKSGKAKFVFEISRINQQNWGNGVLVQTTWDQSAAELRPGDKWNLTMKLKQPRNYANPGGFDTEKHYFQQRISALANVKTKSKTEFIQRRTWLYPIQNLRQELLSMVQQELFAKEFHGVIVALLLGSKHAISSTQSQIMQNTGTAHLMAISGMHIGLIASMLFAILRFGWRFTSRSWLAMPAPWVAAWGALLISIYYALLAGFSVATQRSLIMILFMLSGLLFRRKISSCHSYYLALIVVLLWDPFVVLNIGFWFSYTAVGLLIYAHQGRIWQPISRWSFKKWLRPQLLISIGLLPITLLFFAQSSMSGPIANLIAIPWVCCTVVPISLSAIILWPIDNLIASKLLHLAEFNFSILWKILVKFNQMPIFSWSPPESFLPIFILGAILGVMWFFAPRGIPGRWWGIVAMLPLLFNTRATPQYGQAEFSLLDVGQGLAAVVRTQQHVLIYDTGARLSADFDLGSRVVVPYLNSQGIKHIDMLLISHADNDHIGGAQSILTKFRPQQLLISDKTQLVEYQPQACYAGQSWEWDGVEFFILHPQRNYYYKKRNDRSCVLMIRAGKHKLLLTGDIETKSERQLIANYAEHLRADLMLVPHHGSKTSSSEEFIAMVRPKYALIPVGYKNQYGHPKLQVLNRYLAHDIQILRTERDGMISFRLGDDLLQASCYKHKVKNFWLYGKS